MADWISFTTRGGEPLLLNMDQVKYIEPHGTDPALSVIDGHTVQVSIQTLALQLNARVLMPELALPSVSPA